MQVAANGTVGVTYYDLRDNTPRPGCRQLLARSLQRELRELAASWANETHVGGPFDLEQAADARGYFVGDYEGMTTNGNVFQPFFGMAVDRATEPERRLLRDRAVSARSAASARPAPAGLAAAMVELVLNGVIATPFHE